MQSTLLTLVLGLTAAPIAAVALGNGSASPSPEIKIVHCAHLVDVEAGKLLGATTIVIEGKRIKEVKAGHIDVAGATQVNDMPTSTCLPGLIDSHVHLSFQTSPTTYSDQFRWNIADYAVRSTVYAKRTLEAGFTTVRNLADGANETIALRNAINAGIVPGPRIFTAGKPIGSTGGHADFTDGYRADLAGDPHAKDGIINGADDAWKAVRQHYKDRADLIKIMPSRRV